MKFLTKNRKRSLPYQYYFIPTLLLTLIGIADTIYLTISHYRNYTNISYASFCAISKAINCDTVSQSPWSILFNVPVALWGFFAYLCFLIILFPLKKLDKSSFPLWGLLFALSCGYVVASMFFGYISAQKIHSYCILCILSYIVSFTLFFYTWIIRRRFSDNSFSSDIIKSISLITKTNFLKFSLTGLLVIVLLVKSFLPHYWQYTNPPATTSIPTGITDDGHPWIGAINPTITIEEFTDYQCFQCAKMHHYLRRLISENPHSIRLIHRNYPMDHEVNPLLVQQPFHVGSGRLALVAIAAQSKNKFWEVNDIIFREIRKKKKNINIKKIAEEVQIDPDSLVELTYAKKTVQRLEEDIHDGLRYNITGTPAYIVSGKLYLGYLPEEIFHDID